MPDDYKGSVERMVMGKFGSEKINFQHAGNRFLDVLYEADECVDLALVKWHIAALENLMRGMDPAYRTRSEISLELKEKEEMAMASAKKQREDEAAYAKDRMEMLAEIEKDALLRSKEVDEALKRDREIEEDSSKNKGDENEN